jgi:hypothetical protein
VKGCGGRWSGTAKALELFVIDEMIFIKHTDGDFFRSNFSPVTQLGAARGNFELRTIVDP